MKMKTSLPLSIIYCIKINMNNFVEENSKIHSRQQNSPPNTTF